MLLLTEVVGWFHSEIVFDSTKLGIQSGLSAMVALLEMQGMDASHVKAVAASEWKYPDEVSPDPNLTPAVAGMKRKAMEQLGRAVVSVQPSASDTSGLTSSSTSSLTYRDLEPVQGVPFGMKYVLGFPSELDDKGWMAPPFVASAAGQPTVTRIDDTDAICGDYRTLPEDARRSYYRFVDLSNQFLEKGKRGSSKRTQEMKYRDDSFAKKTNMLPWGTLVEIDITQPSGEASRVRAFVCYVCSEKDYGNKNDGGKKEKEPSVTLRLAAGEHSTMEPYCSRKIKYVKVLWSRDPTATVACPSEHDKASAAIKAAPAPTEFVVRDNGASGNSK